MFCIVSYCEPKIQPVPITRHEVRKKRRRIRKNREKAPEEFLSRAFNLEKISVSGYPHFHVLRISLQEAFKPDAARIFRAYGGRLIFPSGAIIPEEYGRYVFLPRKLPCELLTHTAVGILSRKYDTETPVSLCVVDRELFSELDSVAFVPRVSRMEIISRNTKKLECLRSAAMEAYGAVLYAGENRYGKHYTVTVNYDGGYIDMSFTEGGAIRTRRIIPAYPKLPEELRERLPADIDEIAVACALSEICGFSLDKA